MLITPGLLIKGAKGAYDFHNKDVIIKLNGPTLRCDETSIEQSNQAQCDFIKTTLYRNLGQRNRKMLERNIFEIILRVLTLNLQLQCF